MDVISFTNFSNEIKVQQCEVRLITYRFITQVCCTAKPDTLFECQAIFQPSEGTMTPRKKVSSRSK